MEAQAVMEKMEKTEYLDYLGFQADLVFIAVIIQINFEFICNLLSTFVKVICKL